MEDCRLRGGDPFDEVSTARRGDYRQQVSGLIRDADDRVGVSDL